MLITLVTTARWVSGTIIRLSGDFSLIFFARVTVGRVVALYEGVRTDPCVPHQSAWNIVPISVNLQIG